MKQEEKGVLIKNKKSDGKSYQEIKNELETFQKSQEVFRECKRQLKFFEKQVKKLTEENQRLKKEKLIKNLVPKERKVNENQNKFSPTLLDMKRIIMVMNSEGKPITKNSIRQIGYGLTLDKVNQCLSFLEKYNIVSHDRRNGGFTLNGNR